MKTSSAKMTVTKIFFLGLFAILLTSTAYPNLMSSQNDKFSDSTPSSSNGFKGLTDSDIKYDNPRDIYALICGVENYPGTENDLEYCVDDANDIEDWALGELHVPEKNLQSLHDSECTEQAILEAIDDIAPDLDDNDYFLFYYGGHGSCNTTVSSQSYSINSPHDYPNNYDHYWYIERPGAMAIRVHFASIQTEFSYDGVYVGDGYYPDYYVDHFSGFYSNKWSSWILTDKVYVELYSDYLYTYYGFRIDKIEVMYPAEPYSLVPYSTDSENVFTGDELKTALDDLRGDQICILDSCYSGGVGQALEATNRLILTASDTDESSLEDVTNEHGLFSYQFLRAWDELSELAGESGPVSLESTFNLARTYTISRSSDIGYTHHPQIFDGRSTTTTFDPFITIDEISIQDKTIYINLQFQGLGGGTVSLNYYNNQEFGWNDRVYRNILAPTDNFQVYQIDLSHSLLFGQSNYVKITIEAKFGSLTVTDSVTLFLGNNPNYIRNNLIFISVAAPVAVVLIIVGRKLGKRLKSKMFDDLIEGKLTEIARNLEHRQLQMVAFSVPQNL